MSCLYHYLKKHKNILSCPKCKRKLFKVDMLSEDQEIRAVNFKPLRSDIIQPIDGEKMLCPLCGAILVSRSGDLISKCEN